MHLKRTRRHMDRNIHITKGSLQFQNLPVNKTVIYRESDKPESDHQTNMIQIINFYKQVSVS